MFTLTDYNEQGKKKQFNSNRNINNRKHVLKYKKKRRIMKMEKKIKNES